MIKVGLTGGIGSGKTTVSSIFKSFGIPTYNSDIRAKELMNNNVELICSIKKILGDSSYKNNSLNTKYISEKVFSEPNLLKKLNKLVHPKVSKDFDSWCTKNKKHNIIIKEAAILIESKAYLHLQKIIVVNAPIDIRIKRVMKRDNSSYKDVEKRINNQMLDSERNKYADYIIKNSGEELLIPQIKSIITKINNFSKQMQL